MTRKNLNNKKKIARAGNQTGVRIVHELDESISAKIISK